MGASLDVYSLMRLRGINDSCNHHLLVKVERPGFSNVCEAEYQAAVEEVEARRDRLVAAYLSEECKGEHDVLLEGELQGFPVGSECYSPVGRKWLDLWVAQTGHGHPGVVMGTAPTEEAFWQEVEGDEDLLSLKPLRPAQSVRAFFIQEMDYPGR